MTRNKFVIYMSVFLSLLLLGLFSVHADAQEKTARTVEEQTDPPASWNSSHYQLVKAIKAAKYYNDKKWYEAIATNIATEKQQIKTVSKSSDNGALASDGGVGDRFDRLAGCESHNNPTDLSPGGKYRGAFQFSLPSWHNAGEEGDPIDYSYERQKSAAVRWSSMADPFSQWPVCWRKTM